MTQSSTYSIIPPVIPSGSIYLFKTESEVEYEVRFARKKDNLLYTTLAFGVLNEEYEGEEYVLTNRHEVFKVMRTISAIVRMYMAEHPNVRTYEFTGEPTIKDAKAGKSKRMQLYKRYIPQIFNSEWGSTLHGNKMIIQRKTNG